MGAFHNLRANLRYYAKVRESDALVDGVKSLGTIMEQMNKAKDLEQMLLLEARGRQVYYAMFNEIITNPAFHFKTRTRRPPKDPLNAMISFGNTCLYQRIATEIDKTALDIRIGFVHSTNKRSESLNLDIAELFKPLIVDRAIFTLVNKRIANADIHFEEADGGGIYLNKEGKRIFLHELDNKIYQTQVQDNHPMTYDSRIREEIRKILRFVVNDVPYKPYKYY